MQEQQLFILENDSFQGLIAGLTAVVGRIEASSSGKEVVDFVAPAHLNSSKAFRCALLALNVDALKSKIEKLIKALSDKSYKTLTGKDGIFYFDKAAATGKVAWLFPGFGSEFPHMISGLQDKFPSVKKWLDLMGKLLLQNAKGGIEEIEEEWLERELQHKKYGLHEIGPYGSITSLAIQEVLKELKVPCNAMIGHSNGENSALIASGILGYENHEQLLQIIDAATSLPKPEEESGQYLMLARIKEHDLCALLEQFKEGAWLAMKNCPGQTVLYIKKSQKKAILQTLRQFRVVAVDLFTDHPYHTEVFQERAQILRPVYHSFRISTGKSEVYSCVDAQPFPRAVQDIRQKALQQWVSPVLFEQTILNCYSKGYSTFIEIGPGNKLQGFVKDSLRGKKHTALSCSQQHTTAWNGLIELAANLWGRQIPIDISRLLKGNTKAKKALVIIPEKKAKKAPVIIPEKKAKKAIFLAHQELMQEFLQSSQRITAAYLSGRTAKKKASETRVKRTALLNGKVRRTEKGLEVETHLPQSDFPLVEDHAMGGVLPVIPFTLSMELLAEAASLLPGFGSENLELTDVKGHSWLMYEGDCLDLRITVEKEAHGAYVQMFDLNAGEKIISPAFEGRVSSVHQEKQRTSKISIGRDQWAPSIDVDSFNKDHLFHGPCFQSLKSIDFWNQDGVQAIFKMPPIEEAIIANPQPEFVIPGPMLDSCGQLMAYWLFETGVRNYAIFPFKANRFQQYQRFPEPGTELVCKAAVQRKFGFVNGSFEFLTPNGKCIGRLDGFQLKMYQNKWIPPLLMNRLAESDLGRPDKDFLEEGAGIWKKILAKTILSPEDYKRWQHYSSDRQITHLHETLGRKELQFH